MKTSFFKISAAAIMLTSGLITAQETNGSMREYLAPEKYQRNIFEDPKVQAPEYDGVKVSIGGDFALQFQALDHETKATNLGTVGTTTTPAQLLTLGSDVNLPTANLDVNAYLAKGVKLHLRTYLSARRHNEAWVKGGYLQIDNLDFISEGLLSGLMENARIKVGMDEINYGDSHFRRTDNAKAINNPFVGNLIMDNFTTEPFLEAYYFKNNFIGMVGVSNGKLNQTPVKGTNDNKPSIYAKIGYDKQIDQDLRVRLTGSVMQTNGLSTGGYLYGADRAGSRYYYVLLTTNDALGQSNADTGRFNPGLKEMTAIQINPFVKYQGLEFFGTYERVTGNKLLNGAKRPTDGSYDQIAAELLYRFGAKEQFYFGGKYNTISGEDYEGAAERQIDRFNIGGGWYMTPNVLAKVEYVNQQYNEGTVWGATSPRNGGKFNGVMLEATIGF
ncbi:hypothetical protein [Planobacterium oryzisoli]|uniref:Porin n=1 Tax=Planobacterium oryzisoli TaxID=2771435 RepID=A0A930YX70_9FLAO|nr:hypothetical protein [Planobacterium oryzisoli]MBF5028000.1 hypothetical protein [Planobacterium oryzisoli]